MESCDGVAGGRAELGRAVDLDQAHAEALLEGVEDRHRRGRAVGLGDLVVAVVVACGGCLCSIISSAPMKLKAVTPSVAADVPEAAGAEARAHHDLAADVERGQHGRVLGVDVEEREGREQHLVALVAHDLADVAAEPEVRVVAEHDALGRAGGAAREEDHGSGRAGCGVVAGGRGGRGRERLVVALPHDQDLDVDLDALDELGLGDDRLALGLREHVGQQVALEGGVDRDLDDARVGHAEPGLDRLAAVVEHQRGLVAGFQAERGERLGDLEGVLVQLAAGEDVVLEADQRAVGLGARTGFDDRGQGDRS